MNYYFQFQGFSTLHHVFVAEPPADAVPAPLNEIARCRWFAPSEIASLSASVPTRGIVELFVRRVAPLAKAADSDDPDETIRC
jgi:8-oxo-dGTP diphosphatase